MHCLDENNLHIPGMCAVVFQHSSRKSTSEEGSEDLDFSVNLATNLINQYIINKLENGNRFPCRMERNEEKGTVDWAKR